MLRLNRLAASTGRVTKGNLIPCSPKLQICRFNSPILSLKNEATFANLPRAKLVNQYRLKLLNSTVLRLKIDTERFQNVYHISQALVSSNLSPSRDVCSRRRFYTSSKQPAPHPVIWVALRNGMKLIIPIFSRVFRQWWFKLPDEKRRKYYEFFMKHRQKLIFLGFGGLLGALMYYMSHLERAPLTDRLRFVTLTNYQYDKIAAFESQKVLLMFGPQILPKNDRRVKTVTQVVRQILKANEDIPQMREKQWKVFVVNSDSVDTCFVLPHGEIFVFTCFLKKLENTDQLAIVLGHEISHAILGHGPETLSWAGFLDWFIIGVMAAIWTVIPFISLAFVTNYFFDKVVSVLLKLPYSRKLELEADDVGMKLAARACFDVRESYAFWTNMKMLQKQSGKAEFPDFLSTHPSHGDRAIRLDAQIPHSLKLREECDCRRLKGMDPRLLADAKYRMMEEDLALQGRV